MNPLVAKEIRLLRPAYAVALLLAAIPIWLLPTQEAGAQLFIFVALSFGTLMMALSSFGREFGMNTFPLLLAQPLTRSRIWRTKVAVLGVMIATVWLLFLASWVLNYSLKAWTFEWFTRNVRADLIAADLLLVSPFVILVSGLWATLLLRQMVAAFWFALLIPVVILVVLDWKGATTLTVSIVFGVYSIIGFWWAWRLFCNAQEAAWTGGEVTLPAWQSSRAAPAATNRTFRPVRTLFWKELKLQQIALVGMGALFLLHLGIVMVRKATHGTLENTLTLFATVLEMFGGIWFIVPLVTGSLNVADERRLGTMEWHLCLPVSSRIQFTIKLLVVIAISGLLSALLLTAAEGIGGAIGAGSMFGSGVNTRLANADITLFSMSNTFMLASIFASLSLVSFYASTLSRNIIQSVATAVVVGIVLVSAWTIAQDTTGAGDNTRRIGSIWLWERPLLTIIAWPTMAVALVWLGYGNFRRLSETRRLWLRNICGLGFTMLGIATVTAGLYNRAWELLTPLEPPHGPARLTAERPPVLRGDYSGGVSILLPDGRLWHDRIVYDPGRQLITFAHNWELGWGGKFSGVASGSHFMEGSNWVDEATSEWGETTAIRSDGTLWVSEKPLQSPWQNGRLIPQPAVKLIKFGDGTDWKRVVRELRGSAMILLKTDGTLWRLGTKRRDLYLIELKPHQLGDESDWAEIISDDWGLYAWKKDGRAWRFYGATTGTQKTPMKLDPEIVVERWENFDKVKWRSLVDSWPCSLGVREDGTLWTYNNRYEASVIVPSELMRIGDATNWISVASGDRMLVALRADGSLWKWELGFWQYGQGRLMERPPVRLGIHDDWVAIGRNLNGIAALAGDGSLWRWPDRFTYYSPSLLRPSRKPEKIENIFDAQK